MKMVVGFGEFKAQMKVAPMFDMITTLFLLVFFYTENKIVEFMNCSRF